MKNKINRTSSPLYEDKPWFKIDNAATLYAATKTKKWSRTFRVSLILDREIDGTILQKALDLAVKRFPFFCVKLRDGLFWSYFERIDERVIAENETDYPYRPVGLSNSKEPCFRVLYLKNRLSLECHHSLTDGNGAFAFLSSLAAIYLSLCGESISVGGIVPDFNDKTKAAEVADSYYEYYDRTSSAKKTPNNNVYLIQDKPLDNFASVIHGICEVSNIKSAAKKHALTITEYFIAILIYTIYNCTEKPVNSPIIISIPIDLRRRFSSHAMRNFVLATDISFDTNSRSDVTFDEICNSIRGKLAEQTTKEALLPEISANVGSASNKVLRIIPYFIKKLFLKQSYKKSQLASTGFFSNVGVLDLPEELSKHIIRAEFCLGSTPYQHFGCTAVSVGEILTFTFSSSNKNTDIQKFFFRFLSADGVNLRIESNIAE